MHSFVILSEPVFPSIFPGQVVKASRRLLHIYRTAIRYRLDELLADLPQAKLVSLALKLPLARRVSKHMPRGERLRLALESLGPIFIKFGQLLSTRRDLVPPDISQALASLQDNVPPFDSDEACKLIEKALGAPVTELFREFSREPLASASIAQVHTAVLNSGEAVVVKVVRPGIEKLVDSDVALLRAIARFVHINIRSARRLRLPEIVRDYENVIFDELNLQVEAANTSQLARNFEGSSQLYVPKVYWDYSSRNVLVMERIDGIPVNRVEELNAYGINLKRLAETGVEIFFTQVFSHSFFHADMHPGNVFVSKIHKENPQYIALDCAIIGTLSKSDQHYLARNMLATFQRDYRKVAELHVESGWVAPGTSVNAFETTMRSLCEPIFERPLSEISFAMMLLQLFQTASRYEMEVQPSLVLLQKTMLNVEGLGKQLYPELDLWQTALPFLEEWQRKRLSPLNNLKIIRDKLPEWIEKFPDVPELIYDSLQEHRNTRHNLQSQVDHLLNAQEDQRRLANSRRHRSGITLVIIGAMTLLPGIQGALNGLPLLSTALLALGTGLLLIRR